MTGNRDKIARVLKYRPYKEERHYMAVYLNALRTGNQPAIDECESFGHDTRHIIMNRRAYDRGLLFGYDSKVLDENGWLVRHEFYNIENIEFGDGKRMTASNYITVGRGANGKWSFGVSYQTGSGGGGYGLDIWGEIFDSRKECIVAALHELTRRHCEAREWSSKCSDTCGNYNAASSNRVVRQVEAMLLDLTVAKQQTLF